MSEQERQGIRIAVVDDHEMFRAGVIATLQPYFTIVGQAADVPSAIEMIADTQPDVVLLDVHVPGGEGGGGAEILRKSQPHAPQTAFLKTVGLGFRTGCGFGDPCRRTRICDEDNHRQRPDPFNRASERRIRRVLAETRRIRALRVGGRR